MRRVVFLLFASCAAAPVIEAPVVPPPPRPPPNPCETYDGTNLGVTAPALGQTGPTEDVPGTIVQRDSTGAVDLVYLAGRVQRTERFRGALPHGLHWTMTSSQALTRLDRHDDPDCCTFYDLGVGLDFAGQCLAGVAVFEPLAKGEVRIRSLRRVPVELGTRGFGFAMKTFGRKADSAVSVVLETEDGREVATSPDHNFTYAKLSLAPGPHRLVAHVRGLNGDAVGHTKLEFEIEMPKRWSLRIGVREVRVTVDADSDGATRATRDLVTGPKRPPVSPMKFERSDPRWKLVYGERFVHVSRTRKNSRRARWTQRAEWITVAEGDSVVIEVEDEDLVFHDHLATFRISVVDLLGVAPAPMRQGHVELQLMKSLAKPVRP